nr:MAG TPA: hypothetical protein [Caudoviricetes sp.]
MIFIIICWTEMEVLDLMKLQGLEIVLILLLPILRFRCQ